MKRLPHGEHPNFIPWPPLLLVGLTLTAILLHIDSPLALEFTGASQRIA